jgi:hypothetical protein
MNMKTLLFTVLTLISFNTEVEASILCHTPRMNKIFEVKDTKVTFFNELDSKANRELASVHSRNKKTENGFTKFVDFENQKHTIHISDMNNFSDVNDYIIIKARTGHEVTYPITCEKR